MRPSKSLTLTMRCTALLACCEVRPQVDVHDIFTTAQHPRCPFASSPCVKHEMYQVVKPQVAIHPASICQLYEATSYTNSPFALTNVQWVAPLHSSTLAGA